jgi:four helix bundle protein
MNTVLGTPPKRKYDLEQRSARFAKDVREFVKTLPQNSATAEDIPQLIRSSGSVAANYIEANEALGKRDFPMRVRICIKESKEASFWLQMCEGGNRQEWARLIDESNQLTRIFCVIIRNFNRNRRSLNIGH